MSKDNNYKSFFWKRFFAISIPIFIIGIMFEPYVRNNPFKTLEDYGEFIFFLLFYSMVISGITAFVISMTWRVKQSRK